MQSNPCPNYYLTPTTSYYNQQPHNPNQSVNNYPYWYPTDYNYSYSQPGSSFYTNYQPSTSFTENAFINSSDNSNSTSYSSPDYSPPSLPSNEFYANQYQSTPGLHETRSTQVFEISKLL
jgi:hypothetical protein